MAGRGPPPKPKGLRQRTNRKGSSVLPSVEDAKEFVVPELPDRPDGGEWHPQVQKWWRSAFTSPMAAEFLPVDVSGGLLILAELFQIIYNRDTSRSLFLRTAAEIRLQESRFGLSPVDRSRLRWEIVRAEKADAKRRRTPPPEGDPRDMLKPVRD